MALCAAGGTPFSQQGWRRAKTLGECGSKARSADVRSVRCSHGRFSSARNLATHRAECSSSTAKAFTVRDVATPISVSCPLQIRPLAFRRAVRRAAL